VTINRERAAATAEVVVRCIAGTPERPVDGATDSAGMVAVYTGRPSLRLDVRDPGRRDDDVLDLEDTRATAEDGTPGCRLHTVGAAGTLTVSDPGLALTLAL